MYLIPAYEKSQPYVQLLIATDDDVHAIRNWREKYAEQIPQNIEAPREGAKKDSHADRTKIADAMRADFERVNAKLAEYYQHKDMGPDGVKYFNALLDRNASTKLEQIKEFTKKPIPIYAYADVMAAIRLNRFNPITGELKELGNRIFKNREL